MKEKKKDFIGLLDDLCFIYKDYIDMNDNSRLEVLIQSNMISMYLYKDNDVIDQFGLVFNNKEKDIYMYLSIVLMKILFASKVIYSRDNVFYDGANYSDIKIIVNDNDLFDRMYMMTAIHRDVDFYDKLDRGQRMRNKVNRNRTVRFLDERVNVTKALLKHRSMK